MVKRKPPCRLFVIHAREQPVALILRRGPARWYHLISWRTDTDTFEHGAWFRGRIYEDRCDLSPDGELFLYFALQGGELFRISAALAVATALGAVSLVVVLALRLRR